MSIILVEYICGFVDTQNIEHVLEVAGGKKTKAANILGIDKTTLWRKLKRFSDTQ